MKNKKIYTIITLALSVFILTACNTDKNNTQTTSISTTNNDIQANNNQTKDELVSDNNNQNSIKLEDLYGQWSSDGTGVEVDTIKFNREGTFTRTENKSGTYHIENNEIILISTDNNKTIITVLSENKIGLQNGDKLISYTKNDDSKVPIMEEKKTYKVLDREKEQEESINELLNRKWTNSKGSIIFKDSKMKVALSNKKYILNYKISDSLSLYKNRQSGYEFNITTNNGSEKVTVMSVKSTNNYIVYQLKIDTLGTFKAKYSF